MGEKAVLIKRGERTIGFFKFRADVRDERVGLGVGEKGRKGV